MARRLIILGAIASQMCACASLPAPEASAFTDIAQASKSSFAALSQSEEDALSTSQLAKVANHQKRLTLSPSCVARDASTEPCYLVVVGKAGGDKAPGIVLTSHTAKLQSLIASISSYASTMSDLAAAKDLDEASAAAGKAVASLSALASAVNPAAGAVATPVFNGLVFTSEQLRISERRRVLLQLARAAEPVIEGAASILKEEATQLRGTLVDVRTDTVTSAMQALADDDQKTPPTSSADRAKLIAAVSQAASAASAARSIRTDFSSLVDCHRALIAALANPKDDLSTSVTNAQAFLSVVKSLTSATSKTAAAS